MTTFNSLEYAQKLQKAGLSKELAETQAQAQFELFNVLTNDHASSKHDVTEIRHEISNLRQDMTALRYDVDKEIKDIRHEITDVKRDIQDLRLSGKKDLELTSKQIIIKMGYMMSGAVFVLIAMMKLMHT